MRHEKLSNRQSASTYFIVNYKIIEKVGLDAAVFLGALIQKHDAIAANIPKDGFFYCTRPDLEKILTMKRKKQEACVEILKEANLIEYEVRAEGINRMRFFKLNDEEISKVTGYKNTDVGPIDTNVGTEETDVSISGALSIKESNNKTIKESNKNITAAAGVSAGQNLLFQLPLVESKKKEPRTADQLKKLTQQQRAAVKIEEAKEGLRDWKEVTLRDFTCYYISEHNKVFSKPIIYDYKGSAPAFKPFLEIAKDVPHDKICELIDLVLEEARANPDTREKWGCLSFNGLTNPHVGQSFIKQAKKKLLGEISTIKVNDFEGMRKKHEAKRLGKEPLEKTVHPSDVYF